MRFSNEFWTSRLVFDFDYTPNNEPNRLITARIKSEKLLRETIEIAERFLPTKFGDYHEDDQSWSLGKRLLAIIEVKEPRLNTFDLMEFATYDGPPDFTGIMKGLVIHNLFYNFFKQWTPDSSMKGVHAFCDFGHDIAIYDSAITVTHPTCKELTFKKTNGCFFTSGNGGDRGDHIKVSTPHDYQTITVVTDKLDPIYCDFWATSLYSDPSRVSEFEGEVYAVDRKGRVDTLKGKYD